MYFERKDESKTMVSKNNEIGQRNESGRFFPRLVISINEFNDGHHILNGLMKITSHPEV